MAQLLADHDDDETLRVGIVTQASPKRVTVVLASGDVVVVSGRGCGRRSPG